MPGAEQVVEHPGDLVDRPEELAGVIEKRQQRAEAEPGRAIYVPQPAEPQGQPQPDAADGLDDRHVDRRADGLLHRGVVHLVGELAELAEVGLLADQRLGGPHAHDALVVGGGDLRVDLADQPGACRIIR